MTNLPCRRAASALLALLLASGCGPQVAPQVTATPPAVVFAPKMRWILQLEDERRLRSSDADLINLLQDAEARVRRRAALAVGRVRLADGIPGLSVLLAGDPDPEVKQMAAFALGLIGQASAADVLVAALADSDPVVQGRAAEALGAIGHGPAAAAIGTMMAGYISAGALGGLAPDDMGFPQEPGIEAVRLGIYALVRLGDYDALAAALVGSTGEPRSRWWPVAYAFQRIANPKAAPVLRTLLQGEGQLTRAFAARGLGRLKDAAASAQLVAIAGNTAEPLAVRIQAVRATGAMGDARGVDMLTRLVTATQIDANLQLEALTALGELRPASAVELFVDLASTPGPSIRAAALRALARTDPDTFVTALSGLDPDRHWSVRASLATTLGEMNRERAEAPLTRMMSDADQRVIPAVIDALVKVGGAQAAAQAFDRLTSDDPVVRAAAARGLAVLKPAGAVAALIAAADAARRDGLYVARTAALDALAALDANAAKPVLVDALGDTNWAVRLRAAELLRRIDPAVDLSSMRPAPQTMDASALDQLVAPPYSPTAYIDTDKGTIQVELAVMDAPRTVANFIALVRKGYFNGVALHRVVPDFVVQDGDPRGDGEGGPGHTIRDEINQVPYLRGTMGMALDWADTGGSQFFITHSPQPHLDGRYTAFGQVSAGIEVVDQLLRWDMIQRIRVWDGVAWIGTQER